MSVEKKKPGQLELPLRHRVVKLGTESPPEERLETPKDITETPHHNTDQADLFSNVALPSSCKNWPAGLEWTFQRDPYGNPKEKTQEVMRYVERQYRAHRGEVAPEQIVTGIADRLDAYDRHPSNISSIEAKKAVYILASHAAEKEETTAAVAEGLLDGLTGETKSRIGLRDKFLKLVENPDKWRKALSYHVKPGHLHPIMETLHRTRGKMPSEVAEGDRAFVEQREKAYFPSLAHNDNRRLRHFLQEYGSQSHRQ